MRIYKHAKSDVYYLDFKVDGKARLRRSLGTKNRKEAEAEAANLISAINENRRSGMPDPVFFADALKNYAKQQKAKNPHTFESSTKYRLAGLLKAFGDYYLHELTKPIVDDYITDRLEEVAQSTVKRDITDLKSVLNLAVANGDLRTCPQFMKLSNAPELVRWLTREEEQRLLEVAKAPLKQALIIALDTGVRKSELFGLRWEYISLEKRLLTLPKTKNNDARHLKLTERVLETLKEIGPKKKGHVFVHQKGKHKGKRILELRRVFQTALTAAEIEDFRFHDLRHTFASRLVQLGIPLFNVSKMLGHKDPKMVERYAHLAPDYQDDAIAALEASQKYGTPLRLGLVATEVYGPQPLDLKGEDWCTRRDSNAGPLPSEGSALSS